MARQSIAGMKWVSLDSRRGVQCRHLYSIATFSLCISVRLLKIFHIEIFFFSCLFCYLHEYFIYHIQIYLPEVVLKGGLRKISDTFVRKLDKALMCNIFVFCFVKRWHMTIMCILFFQRDIINLFGWKKYFRFCI